MNKETELIMKYFVLKPAGDNAYAEASRLAMRAYATKIYGENAELAKELREWADRETPILKQIKQKEEKQ